jgi:hypothetical protein
MIMVKPIKPPAPMPAIPRPATKTVMEGAAPQTNEPTRKKKMANRIMFFLFKENGAHC